MYSAKNIILFLTILFCSFNGFSQEKNDLPISIYSSKTQLSFLNKRVSINDNLDLKGFKFVILDIEDIKSGLFTVSSINYSRTPTKYIYDSYKKIIFNETAKYYDPNKLAILPRDNF